MATGDPYTTEVDTIEVSMFKGTLRIAGTDIEMLQLDEFRQGTILAENDEFLTVKWPPLPDRTASASGSACYPALTVVYRKDSVRQGDNDDDGERLIDVTPVIEWESYRAPPQAGQDKS